jgi:ribose 5-phosphate isomerase B
MKWFIGSDHAGYRLKAVLADVLLRLGDEVVDLGAQGPETSVDYPDYGEQVGRAVAADSASRGLLCCGTGIGICMAAGKIAGVRAARVTESFSARMARAHNDANVLCLGERVTGPGVAEEILQIFRATPFEGGRHQRRVDKLGALDRGR